MRVAVGSLNPIKIRAVKAIISTIYPNAEVIGVEVKANVPSQPLGDEETIAGAVARARMARQELDADLGIGIEGGVNITVHGYFTNAWCVVADMEGQISIGGNICIPLPPAVIDALSEGYDLGEAMDRLTGTTGSKEQMGAVGILTQGLLDRQRAYEVIITYALVKHLNPNLYNVGDWLY